MARFTNWLADMYRAKSWRRVIALGILSPLVFCATISLPFFVLYLACVWDGR